MCHRQRVSKARLGVALLVPVPQATEIDGLRRALDDGALGRIPAHITLVPPVNVREDRLEDALAVLRTAAAATSAITLTLGPVGTFSPVNPVVYLSVGGKAAAVEGLRRLRDAVFTEPLSRSLTWPWVPHVTLADEADPARIAAALTALAGYTVEVTFDRVHLLQEGPGRVWELWADAPFAPPAVVGRGGLPLELHVSDRLDPLALLGGLGSGRPFAITARRDGIVVGTTAGVTHEDGGEAELRWLIVDPAHRRQGIGAHLVAAVSSLAAERGCAVITSEMATTDAVGFFLRRMGWADDDGRLRRALGPS